MTDIERMQLRRLFIDGGLVVAWATLIWILGGGSFSASETSRILGPLLEWLFPDWTLEARQGVAAAIRKLAHPIEYGVFAVLALRFVHTLRRQSGRAVAVLIECSAAVAATAVLAALDEARQSTLDARTGSAFDVGLDVAGAVVALLVVTAMATAAGGALVGVPGWRRTGPADAGSR